MSNSSQQLIAAALPTTFNITALPSPTLQQRDSLMLSSSLSDSMDSQTINCGYKVTKLQEVFQIQQIQNNGSKQGKKELFFNDCSRKRHLQVK